MEEGNIASVYDLPYEDTFWGKCYATYRNMNHIELRKVLMKETAKWNAMRIRCSNMGPQFYLKACQSLFYKTDNGQTPAVLLREKCEYTRVKNYEKKNEFAYKVFEAYRLRRKAELAEVVHYYRTIRSEYRTERRTKANEKIECEICKQMISRTNKSRHMKLHK